MCELSICFSQLIKFQNFWESFRQKHFFELNMWLDMLSPEWINSVKKLLVPELPDIWHKLHTSTRYSNLQYKIPANKI